MLCISYYIKLKLMKNQKIVSETENLLSSGLLYSLILEIILIVPHPNQVTHNIKFDLNSANPTTYYVNDMLSIIILIRFYIFFRVILNNTIYAGTRALRLCRIYGTDGGLFFSLKCLL